MNPHFDVVDFTDITGVSVNSISDYDTPDRNLTISKLARNDRSILTSAEYSQKRITIKGIITGTDYENLMQNRTTFLSYMQAQNSTLTYEINGYTKQYNDVTMDRFTTNLYGGECEFTIDFIAADPIAIDSNLNQFLQPNHFTASTTSYQVINTGSYTALPVINITLSLLTGGTSQSVQVVNASNGQGITITRTWTALDEIEVDCFNRTVMVNGLEVDYTGIFPEFDTYTQSLQYIDSLTTRSGVISAQYYRRFI